LFKAELQDQTGRLLFKLRFVDDGKDIAMLVFKTLVNIADPEDGSGSTDIRLKIA